jgi:hypothetical protein
VPLEHIVQDAGSDDGTLDWLRDDPRVRAFVEKDQGMYDAINRGFRRATGDIFAWLNCDEQYLPGALRSVTAFFDSHPAVDVLFGDVVMVDAEGRYLGGAITPGIGSWSSPATVPVSFPSWMAWACAVVAQAARQIRTQHATARSLVPDCMSASVLVRMGVAPAGRRNAPTRRDSAECLTPDKRPCQAAIRGGGDRRRHLRIGSRGVEWAPASPRS